MRKARETGLFSATVGGRDAGTRELNGERVRARHWEALRLLDYQ